MVLFFAGARLVLATVRSLPRVVSLVASLALAFGVRDAGDGVLAVRRARVGLADKMFLPYVWASGLYVALVIPNVHATAS